MRKKATAASTLLGLALVLSSPAIATTVTVGGVPGGSSGEFSPLPGASTVDFDSPNPAGWAITGDYQIVSGSSSGHYAAPPNSGPNANTSEYLTVPYGASSGSATITLGGYYNYYGLYWGSVDSYNTLSFLDGGTEVFSYTGTQAAALVPTAPNGEQALAAYFNFANLPLFNSVRMTSTSFAFETDNHAFARVPVPATGALLALGCAALAFARRRVGQAAEA